MSEHVFFSEVRAALRIAEATTSEYPALGDEIRGLIDAAREDLRLAGVTDSASEDDPLIKRAVITYCKANFGYDNPDADRLQLAYNLLKVHLALSAQHNAYAVTFTVSCDDVPVSGAEIILHGGKATLKSNSLGVAVYEARQKGIDIAYSVHKGGYEDVGGSVYVNGDTAVGVILHAT